MRYGRRFASAVIGLILVVGVMVWLGRSRSLHAQAPPSVVPDSKAPSDAAPVLTSVPVASERNPLPPALEPAPAGLSADELPPYPPRRSPPVEPEAAQPAPAAEDPDQTAERFVDLTRQQADAQIKALTAEAEQLRARLKKVESAIERWQTLRNALDQKPVQAQAEVGLPPQADVAVTPKTATGFDLPGPASSTTPVPTLPPPRPQ